VTERASQCPRCGEAGAAIDRITLKALLTPDALRRGIPAHPRYCASAPCPIVYFDAVGEISFTEAELVVQVYAKHPDDPDVPVCYCFGVNAGLLTDARRARAAREMVAYEVQAGHCACEVKNPKGACCLGDFVRAERANEQPATEASCCAVS
jgi:hypothetical protein